MASTMKIKPRTEYFISALEKLKDKGRLPSAAELLTITGIKSRSTISEIKGRRQNIKPEAWEKFKKHFRFKDSDFSEPGSIEKGEEAADYNDSRELIWALKE